MGAHLAKPAKTRKVAAIGDRPLPWSRCRFRIRPPWRLAHTEVQIAVGFTRLLEAGLFP